MVQQHMFSVGGAKSADTVMADAVLRFDPDTIVRAIAYHLIDEGLAKDVAENTIERTIVRLNNSAIRPSIARRRWATMSNPQRLRWILMESETTLTIGADATARL